MYRTNKEIMGMLNKVGTIDNERFKPVLYSNLHIPSLMHGYSLGMELMQSWFTSKFSDGYFKSVHIVGKSIYDDFRKFCYGDYAKRIKPALAINSQIQYDYDRETLDMYLQGPEIFLRKSNYQNSFFKDIEKDIYLGFTTQLMLINFAFRIKVSTKAEQMDLQERMKLYFRIGGTHKIDYDMDFNIPYDMMLSLAYDAGFSISNKVIDKPYEFIAYLNQHSQLPFLYKARYINQRYEFFIRMQDISVHISTKDKLNVDEGEQEGMTMNNYTIEMQAILRLPVPQFFIYYSSQQIRFPVETLYDNNNAGVSMYSIKQVSIPEINSKRWNLCATSNYVPDKDEAYIDHIDIRSLFDEPVSSNDSVTLSDVIKQSIDSFISPSLFVDIGIYTNDLTVKDRLAIEIDWENMVINMPANTIYSMLYIAVYLDSKYVNEKYIELGEMNKGRLK